MTTSLAILTPAQAAAQAAVGSALPSAAGATSPADAAASAGSAALSTLGSNFNQFLNLLLTQLKNQDPTAPLDANAFTTELVQFTGVQQQVNTNASLTQLINLSQQSQVLSATQYIGHKATVTSTALTLQQGSAQIGFSGTAGEQVGIAVVGSTGALLRTATVTATDGANSWTWDGKDNNGNQVADGAYRVAVDGAIGDGAPTALPFSVVGTATAVSNAGTAGLQLSLGALTVGLGSVQSVAQD